MDNLEAIISALYSFDALFEDKFANCFKIRVQIKTEEKHMAESAAKSV